MTPEQHILDALKTMEERGVEPTMQDWEAMAELLNDGENETTTNRISTGATGSRQHGSTRAGELCRGDCSQLPYQLRMVMERPKSGFWRDD